MAHDTTEGRAKSADEDLPVIVMAAFGEVGLREYGVRGPALAAGHCDN